MLSHIQTQEELNKFDNESQRTDPRLRRTIEVKRIELYMKDKEGPRWDGIKVSKRNMAKHNESIWSMIINIVDDHFEFNYNGVVYEAALNGADLALTKSSSKEVQGLIDTYGISLASMGILDAVSGHQWHPTCTV